MKIIDFNTILPDISKFPIYFHPGYIRYVERDGVKCYLFYDGCGNYIPFRIYTKWIFKIGQFLFTPFCPNQPISSSQELQCLQNFERFLRSNKICDVVNAPLHVSLFRNVPKSWESWQMGIISLDISSTLDDVFKNFSRTYRTQINQCTKLGFTVSYSDMYFDSFYENYKLHHLQQNIEVESYNKLKELLNNLDYNATLFSVLNNRMKWEGGALVLHDAFRGYYFIGAKNEEIELHNGAQKFLHFKVIEFLQDRNIPIYNFGGYRTTSNANDRFDSIQNFKLKFGSSIESGIHTKIHLNFKDSMFNTLVKLKQKIG
jgi:hypothetical protein